MSELKKVFASLSIELSEKELKDLIAEVDDDNSGSIEREEFLALMAERKVKFQLEQSEIFKEVFKHIDVNQNGFIEFEDLKIAMELLDFELSDDDIAEMMALVDRVGNGKLNFHEFKTFLMKLEKTD